MTDYNPLVSIIVPVYMVEKYIKQCLDSIIVQTYNHFEVIMINDGTLDNSGVLAKEYTKDFRFHYFEKKNEGISSVRNMGVRLARGEYVCFIDSDDYVSPFYLENLVCGICDCDLCICYYATIEEGKNTIYPKQMDKMIIEPNSIWDLKSVTNRMVDVPWNKLYKRNIVEGLLYPVGHIHEDSLVLSTILNNCTKVSIIDKCLYYYRQRHGSIMDIARKTNSSERFNVYLGKIDYYISIERGDLAFESFMALVNDLYLNKPVLKKKNEYTLFKKKTMMKAFKILFLTKINITKRFKIIVYMTSPWLYFALRKNKRKIDYAV